MRATLIGVVALLQGCALAQLGEDLADFYADPQGIASGVVAEMRMGDLDSPSFMERNGRKGLWQPLEFVREKRGGVYLLEPYDAGRIPVLFVHGAGGTPQDWRYFIAKLDRSRYQAWVYYYPAGLPIDMSAAWLDSFIGVLHRQYGFRQLAIAAHSMGGLVARRFVAMHGEGAGPRYETLLVTFATPFGGVPLARLASSLGSYALPSWRDLAPGSAFLRALHAQPLPVSVQHHLFFGYRGDGDAFDSDGVISVASQLGAKAARSHGFRTDHTDILEDAAVFKRFAGLLTAID